MNGRGGLDPYEADDWARYGGAGRKLPDAGSEELLHDDPFADYRYENGLHPPEDERPPRRRARSNLVGALVAVAVIAAAAAFVNLAAPNLGPSPSPARTPRPSAPTGTPLLSMPASRLHLARVAVEIPIPLPIVMPDRGFAFDDGANMYLAGNLGALPVDVAAGTVGAVWSGADFPKGLRRLIYDDGVWMSAWPAGYATCGPPCWDKATTYRIDPGTGAVTLTLEGAFLAGAQYDGVYVASAGRLRTLDPEDGHELASIVWKTAGEPRLGCGQVWSVEVGGTTELRAINPNTGDQTHGSSLPSGVSSGPIYSEGLCWMMSGQNGASIGATRLALLNTDGTVIDDRTVGGSIVVLDSEFWMLSADGIVQRFEAVSSGLGYGDRYVLPIQPENGDPGALFSAVGTLWLYRGQELIGFDVLTGSSNAGK